ncbi:MAG TPA: hypothetical protein DCY24_05035 [Rikenellaceae bacterium]|nr:hypothetical protein [Rikenellaceae bacterium]
MIDKKVQMMDAGMVLFTSEKPFGTVLGGIKAELTKLGEVKRANEISMDEVPDTTGVFDLFVDWSSPFRWRAISCRLEDAGLVGTNADGNEIRRYALCLKEGNKNRRCKVAAVLLVAVIFIIGGICGIDGVPGIFTVPAGVLLAGCVVIFGLRPSVKAQNAIRNLAGTVRKAK